MVVVYHNHIITYFYLSVNIGFKVFIQNFSYILISLFIFL